MPATFGQPGGQQPGCGFPVAHLMGLFHAGTGMVLKMLSAPLRTHDLSQVVPLHPELRPGDVLVTDRACVTTPIWPYWCKGACMRCGACTRNRL
jgi:hypothetical protein